MSLRFPRRSLSMLLATATATIGLSGLVAVTGTSAAVADTAPVTGTPATASTDVLPTAQVNGVVWAQVVVGDTVWATGSFSKIRPAGVAAGGAGELADANIVSFSISTGALTSFQHTMNAQGLGISASPDGTKVYVAGDFTTIDGQARNHLAAFDTANGALDTSFKPNVNAKATSIQATNSTVYVGGNFSAVGGVTHTKLAAVNATTGAVLPWTASADDNMVTGLALNKAGTTLVVGGRFTTMNGGQAAYGLGAVSTATGALVPWAAASLVQDAGNNAGITSLSTDGTTVYGTGYVFGAGGNVEGTFSADATTGALNWLEDCHGDTYGAYPIGDVVYTVSHAHFCGDVPNGFPQTSPDWVFHRGMAFTKATTGVLGTNPYGGYANFAGTPAPSVLHFWPTLAIGSATGQSQAAWSVTGTSKYVVMGGEFPRVNNTAQQGLVRFGIGGPPTAPNKVGPVIPGSAVSPVISTTSGPAVVSLSTGSLRVSWTNTWDQDNENLTYTVLRDGGATPVFTTTQASRFDRLASTGFTDTGLAVGSTHSYRVRVTDPNGNFWTSTATTGTVGNAGAASAYQQAVTGDGAANYWRLGEASGSTAYDYAGFNDGTESAGVGHGATGAIQGDTNGASTFNGSSTGVMTSGYQVGPTTYSIEAWVNTTSTSGGKIVGFGDTTGAAGNSGSYDRHVYMGNNGQITFGAYSGQTNTITSSKAYNDGKWHHIVATMGPSGMVLYVDDKKIGTNNNTVSQSYSGYWRVGGDNIGGWPNQPSSFYLNGSIDDVAIYNTVLTRDQVDHHYVLAGGTSTLPVTPTDSYGKSVAADSPDIYWRLGESSGATAADTELSNDGNFTGGYTRGVNGVYTNGATLNGSDGILTATGPVDNPTVYSEELWFKTTTTSGGKLIGFGDQQTGNSNSYDRHVWMVDSGQLVFGTWTGQTNTANSTQAYNDGNWHQMVATQGSDGMKLYVDGALVGTNPQTQAQAYTGYWRVGGDTTWGGNSSNYFAGTVDEVAIYSTALSAARVSAHYAASGLAANQAPTAAFTSNCPTPGLQCSFTSTSTDPDGSIASYAWDFGDGATSTDANPVHTFAAGGDHSVKLTVTDNGGLPNAVTNTVTLTAPNQNPTAAFASSCPNPDLGCTFNAGTSSDPDGTIASYAWDFGDGTSGTGVNPSHTYASSKAYTVVLTVTDNQSGTGTTSASVTPIAPPNQNPTAVFTSTGPNLTWAFDGSTSSDPDGTIASYAWDFGDGTTATGPTPSHTFAAGTWPVKLTVTDNSGGMGTVTHSVVASGPANVNPTAVFTSTGPNLTWAFNGSTSSDPDGTIASYAWDFGDGTTATGPTPSHTFAAGTWPVKLTVTDNSGGMGTVTHSVVASGPANVNPTAVFTSTGPNLTWAFNGSTSSDPDGTIASYAWDFGDGTTATGPTPSHTFAAGTWPVKLTVTDNSGGMGTVTHSVVAAPAAAAPYAVDAFGRTVTNGLGTADTGGAWTGVGTASNFAVAGGVGTIKMGTAGAGPGAYLNGVQQTSTDLQVTVTTDKVGTGGGIYLWAVGRHTAAGDYRARVRLMSTGAVGIELSKVVSGTETLLTTEQTLTGVTYTAGTQLRIRMQVDGTGTTNLRLKVWKVGTTEPATWQRTATDTTAGMQVAGSVGVYDYLSSSATNSPVVASWDDLKAQSVAAAG